MESLEELTRRNDFTVLILPKVQEVCIARHDVVRLPLHGSHDEFIVGRIAAYAQLLLAFNQDTRLGKPLKQLAGLLI